MLFFLDTADLMKIRKYATWGIIDGVTTNPSLIAKEGKDISFKSRILEIAKLIKGPISAEVMSDEVSDIIKEAREIALWHNNIYIKIPMTSDGLQAVKILSAEGIKTNVTLVFSVSQGVLAAKAGATFISPFIGRIDDLSGDGLQLLAELKQVFSNYDFSTKILAASIRSPYQVAQAMQLGIDIATIPPNIFDQLIHHPLTDKGITTFKKDWENFSQ